MERDGLCFQCLVGAVHIWHDNGTRNYAHESIIPENNPPTMEGEGYDAGDQEDE